MPARRIDSTSQFTTAVFTLIARNRRFKVDLLGTHLRYWKCEVLSINARCFAHP